MTEETGVIPFGSGMVDEGSDGEMEKSQGPVGIVWRWIIKQPKKWEKGKTTLQVVLNLENIVRRCTAWFIRGIQQETEWVHENK